MIDPNDKQTLDLVDAAEGRPALRLVTPELTASMDAQVVDEVRQKPLTPADRQRRRREKRKQLSVEQGLKAVLLLEVDRLILRQALDLYRGLEGLQSSEDLYRGILQKLAPGADWFPDGGSAQLFRQQHQQELAKAITANNNQDVESRRQTRRVQEVERELKSLQQRVADLEAENSNIIAERGRAFDAVQVLQGRLKRAGLVSDYRPQSGEQVEK